MNDIEILKPVYIYLITNKFNNKVYVGQTKNPNHRWSAHKCEARRDKLQLPIYHALRKYGTENFNFEIIETCHSQDQANKIEIIMINKYNSRDSQNGYNVSPGGLNFVMSEETKRKIGEANKGRLKTEEEKNKISNTLKGQKHTEERKKNQSKARLGKKSWNAGTKGIMKSNSGSFKKGESRNKGKPSPIKGRKKIIDEKGNIKFINPENFSSDKELT